MDANLGRVYYEAVNNQAEFYPWKRIKAGYQAREDRAEYGRIASVARCAARCSSPCQRSGAGSL
jgi:hypothetical protein